MPYTADGTFVAAPGETALKRAGVVPVLRGSDHRVVPNVALPINRPRYAIVANAGDRARHPVETKAGKTAVMLPALSLAENASTPGHRKWICMNPECKNKHWDSAEELRKDHPADRELANLEKNRTKDESFMHPYACLVEIPATPEGMPASCMLLTPNGDPEEYRRR